MAEHPAIMFASDLLFLKAIEMGCEPHLLGEVATSSPIWVCTCRDADHSDISGVITWQSLGKLGIKIESLGA